MGGLGIDALGVTKPQEASEELEKHYEQSDIGAAKMEISQGPPSKTAKPGQTWVNPLISNPLETQCPEPRA